MAAFRRWLLCVDSFMDGRARALEVADAVAYSGNQWLLVAISGSLSAFSGY